MSGEIEVKYRVHDVATLERVLAAQGIELSPPVFQDDQAYAPAGWAPGQPRIGVTFARLRTQDSRCTFTTKTPVDNVLACREFETPVGDRAQMHEAILAMGYRPTVRVAKQRRTGRVGAYALCVDDIEGVGAFLELESVSGGTEDMLRVQAEMAAWVEQQGLPVERTGATYDQLVAQPAVTA